MKKSKICEKNPTMLSADDFPEGITEAILSFLPLKTVGRFRSVSKSWNSVVSSPSFIRAHRHRAARMILVSSPGSFFSVDISRLSQSLNGGDHDIPATAQEVPFGGIRWKLVTGSCNGLVLLLAQHDDTHFFLINPLTRELCEFPLSPFAHPDQGNDPVPYGFGYVSSTDDYKVVSISYSAKHDDTYVSVFSTRQGSWRKLPDSIYDHRVSHIDPGLLLNERLHWIAGKRPGNAAVILAFCLADETFTEIDMPRVITEDALLNELIDLGGKLGICGGSAGNDMWVMEEYGVSDSWSKVSIDEEVEIGPYKPLCLVEESSHDIVLYDIADYFTVVVYNIDRKRCRNVRIEGGPSEFLVKGMYFETLESPKRIITPPY